MSIKLVSSQDKNAARLGKKLVHLNTPISNGAVDKLAGLTPEQIKDQEDFNIAGHVEFVASPLTLAVRHAQGIAKLALLSTTTEVERVRALEMIYSLMMTGQEDYQELLNMKRSEET